MSKHLWCDSELSPAKDAQNLRNSDGLPHNKGQSSVTQAMSDNNDSDIEVIMVSRARKRQEPPLPPAIKLEPGLGDQEVESKKTKHEPKEEIAKKVKRQGPRVVVFQLAKTC